MDFRGWGPRKEVGAVGGCRPVQEGGRTQARPGNTQGTRGTHAGRTSKSRFWMASLRDGLAAIIGTGEDERSLGVWCG